MDPAFIQAIAEGGAPYALIVLIVWVILQGNKREELLRSELTKQKEVDLEQANKREDIMRTSFASREERFLDVIQSISDKTAAAITESALKMADALSKNTQAIVKIEENIEKNLDEMRRARI